MSVCSQKHAYACLLVNKQRLRPLIFFLTYIFFFYILFCNNSSVKCQNFWKICKTHDKKIAALCENVINKRRYVFFSAFFRKIENYSDTSALLHFLSFFPRMQTLKNNGYKYFLKSHSNLFTWYAISIPTLIQFRFSTGNISWNFKGVRIKVQVFWEGQKKLKYSPTLF